MAKAKVFEPAELGFTQEQIDHAVKNARPYPYGPPYVNKQGTTHYKAERGKHKDLIGYRFGNLVVLGKAPDYITPGSGQRFPQYYCWCVESETVGFYRAAFLKNGHSTRSQAAGSRRGIAARHGRDVSEVRAFKTVPYQHPYGSQWHGMMTRTGNMGDADRPSHRGRGVDVCHRVRDFDRFVPLVEALDVKVRAYLKAAGFDDTEKLTFERPDPNDHYREGNFSLAPRWMQQHSTRRSLDIVVVDELNDELLAAGVAVHLHRAKAIALELGVSWRTVDKWVRPSGRSHANLKPRAAFLRAYRDDIDDLVLSNEPCDCPVCTGPKPTDPQAIPKGKLNGYQLTLLIDACDALAIELFPNVPFLSARDVNSVIARATHLLGWPAFGKQNPVPLTYSNGVFWRTTKI